MEINRRELLASIAGLAAVGPVAAIGGIRASREDELQPVHNDGSAMRLAAFYGDTMEPSRYGGDDLHQQVMRLANYFSGVRVNPSRIPILPVVLDGKCGAVTPRIIVGGTAISLYRFVCRCSELFNIGCLNRIHREGPVQMCLRVGDLVQVMDGTTVYTVTGVSWHTSPKSYYQETGRWYCIERVSFENTDRNGFVIYSDTLPRECLKFCEPK